MSVFSEEGSFYRYDALESFLMILSNDPHGRGKCGKCICTGCTVVGQRICTGRTVVGQCRSNCRGAVAEEQFFDHSIHGDALESFPTILSIHSIHGDKK